MTGYGKTGRNKWFPFSRATCHPKSGTRMTLFWTLLVLGRKTGDMVVAWIYTQVKKKVRFLALYHLSMCLMPCRRFKFNGFEYVMKCLGSHNVYGKDFENKETDLVAATGEWWHTGAIDYVRILHVVCVNVSGKSCCYSSFFFTKLHQFMIVTR